MGMRLKIFLIFLACGLAPMLLLSVYNYFSGTRAVESMLLERVERDSSGMAHAINADLRAREEDLISLARSAALQNYVRDNSATNAALTEELRAHVTSFLLNNKRYYKALTCFSSAGAPLFYAEISPNDHQVTFQTEAFYRNDAEQDSSAFHARQETPLRKLIEHGPFGAALRYTVPVLTKSSDTANNNQADANGALALDLKLDTVFKDVTTGLAELSSSASPVANKRTILVLHSSGLIFYHSNAALHYQPVTSAMPNFKGAAEAMMRGEAGEQFFEAADGDHWLVSYRPLGTLDLSVAAAEDYTKAVSDVRRTFILSLAASATAGLLLAIVLTLVVGRTARSIERVTEGAVAIAGGNLNERIEVRSSDETRLLADTFNLMTDRLREKIAHEAEVRQFESFIRISAMLTHDLKNAIAALSLLVSNMERQFHREEFRADAMKSLKAATDKLRAIVAKLSDPVETLSGEHKRPRPTDLVAMMRRVLAATAEPARSLHEIETRLPDALVAPVDAERMEKVMENLIINALEAMGTKHGKLEVVAGEEDAHHVFFSVADTGPGMTEEFQRTRLFRPFATTKRHGVGLGLYTCREIVRAHGGRLEVESKKGSGTTFRVVLPSEQIAMSVGRKSSAQ